MKLRVLDGAENEIAEAVDYYEAQSRGLGLRVTAEIRDALHKILTYPDAQARYDANHRRRNLVKFPYGLFFRIGSNEVILAGFFHQRSDPTKWTEALRSR